MRRSAILASLVLSFGAGCATTVHDADGDVQLGKSNARWSFELPGDGQPNDNTSIGPFCCTGETAVVTADGHDIGYGYFFTWKGQAYTDGTDSWTPDVEIKVAGVKDLENPSSPLVEGAIDFDAAHVASGSKQTTQAGALVFTVTVEHVDVTPQPSIEMNTFAVRLDVDPAG